VRVEVAEEQQHLEEQHAHGPHGGRSAEPRQDDLRDQRLDLEEQERREKDGGGVQAHIFLRSSLSSMVCGALTRAAEEEAMHKKTTAVCAGVLLALLAVVRASY